MKILAIWERIYATVAHNGRGACLGAFGNIKCCGLVPMKELIEMVAVRLFRISRRECMDTGHMGLGEKKLDL
jgi:hypothetical protein